jgi:DNA phosphorothioation-dependent restriction protein DptG
MPLTRREILQQKVQDYEADLRFYETLFIQTSEILYCSEPKCVEEVMKHMFHLLETIDELKGEKIPKAKGELQEFLKECG